MKRRRFAALDRELSEIGFGGSSLGGVFGPVDDDEAIRAVHRALDLGIDYFDVAPFYGLGRAETLLGRALRDIRRDRYVLSTKVGRYGERDFDFSAARVRSSLRESQTRLGIDHIDIVFAHDIEFGDPTQIREETIPALRALQREGAIGVIGISGYPLDVLQRTLDASPVDVVLSYGHYHLRDQSCDSLVLGDASLIAAAPLAMGLLTREGPPAWHPASTEERASFAQLVERAHGIDIARLAIRFALTNARAASTLVGMRTVAEVEANAAAADASIDDELAQIKA